jgi:hypothetical protein
MRSPSTSIVSTAHLRRPGPRQLRAGAPAAARRRLARVVVDAGGRDGVAVLARPGHQGLDRVEERRPERGQVVVDARRDHRVDRPPDEAIALQPAQGEREHPLADAVDLAAQPGEALRALAEQLDDEQRPLVRQAVEQVADLARLRQLGRRGWARPARRSRRVTR